MRLVTRGDLDGLTCAVLITLNEPVNRVSLIHPQDITDGRVEITPEDILANLPYHDNCAMWFDHHQHTATPAAPTSDFKGAFGQAPSAARLVYDYYGGEEKMPQYVELVNETDRLDSANLEPEDVTHPQGYIKLGFTIDGRTGIGSFEQYFMMLLQLLRKAPPLEEVLAHPEVKKRCDLLEQGDAQFRQALKEHSQLKGNVVVSDFRQIERPPIGNRFLIYALYPECNVSVRLQWGPRREYPIMTIGHSIFNRTCNTNVGDLAARYGGGGHKGAGSIPLLEDPEIQIQMIVGELIANG